MKDQVRFLTVLDLGWTLEQHGHEHFSCFRSGGKWHAITSRGDGSDKCAGVGDTMAEAIGSALDHYALRHSVTT